MLLFNRYEYNPQADIAGRGEFSRIYRAVDNSNQEPVAVKIYKINDFSDHYRPIQDAQMIRTLDHPGLCTYFDIEEMEKEDSFGEKEKLQVCITAFMNAGNLVTYFKAHHDLTLLRKLLLNVLNGLSYLHKKGIIHGYIKPSNILVTETNAEAVAKITDYAMGIFSPGASAGTGSHLLLSAVAYSSPEQLNAPEYGIDGGISFNTDLWSLALVIYEALTGEPLFTIANTDFPETITNRITGFEPREKLDALPEPFKTLLLRCLVKDAGQRAKTVDELLPLLSEPETGDILQLEEKPASPLLSPELATLSETEDNENADDTRIIALPKKDKHPPIDLGAKNQANDDTTIISPLNNNAQPIRNPVIEDAIEDDATKVIARPADSQIKDSSNSDTLSNFDTRIIGPVNNNAPPSADSALKDNSEDDATRIITRPADSQITDSSNSDTVSNDDTIIMTPVNDNAQSSGDSALKDNSEDDSTRIIARQADSQTVDSSETGSPEDKPIDQTIIIASVNKEKQRQAKKDNGARAGRANTPATGEDTVRTQVDKEKQPDIVIRRREKPVVLFNRYEYLPATDLIGKGGFSRVYKAYDKKLSRWVALKIYKTGEFSDRYSPIAEIKRVVNLDHSNICRYLDIEEIENENPFGENEKIQVCVMELLDSGNFADYYKANKNPETLKKLIQDILNGLSYLHKNGIIHRDIKPGNILIKQTIEGPVAKITDFGISKNSDAENNSSSALIVSIPYMAPEQLNAKKYGINEKISFNLDLWSLGVTIYEVVTGKALFKNSDQDNSEQIMSNIMAPELPAKLNDLPEPFKAIVSHCVIKNARERASRAEELMVLLNTQASPASTTEVLASQAANTISEIEKESIMALQAETEQPKMEVTVLPLNAVDKIPASRFSIAAEEEKPIAIREKKKVNYLGLVIGTAVLLFILFIIYLKTGNQAPVLTNAGGAIKKDSAKMIVAPVKPPDTGHANTVNTEKNTGAAAKNTVVAAPPVRVNEKKKEGAVEENRKKGSSQADKSGGTTAAKYVLILSAEQPCTLKVNSIDYGNVGVGPPMKLFLVTGKYILQFVSTSNSASTFTATIEVKPENLGHADKFKIQLK